MGVTLVSVEVRNGDITKALKVFKNKVEKSNHLNELRQRRYFVKPSLEKRESLNKVKHRMKKERENRVD